MWQGSSPHHLYQSQNGSAPPAMFQNGSGYGSAAPEYGNNIPMHQGGSPYHQQYTEVRHQRSSPAVNSPVLGSYSLQGPSLQQKEQQHLSSYISLPSPSTISPSRSPLHGPSRGPKPNLPAMSAISLYSPGAEQPRGTAAEDPARRAALPSPGRGGVWAAPDGAAEEGERDRAQLEQLRAQLAGARAREQELQARVAALAAQNQGMQEQLTRAGAREAGYQEQLRERGAAEREWTLPAESPRRLSDAAGARDERDQTKLVEGLMRRLRARDRELQDAQARIAHLQGALATQQHARAAKGGGGSGGSRGQSSETLAAEALSVAGTREGEEGGETRRLRERVKIVEEALRAMRDEAREHVLAIKSQDILLNSMLGTGSFAEVHAATWHLPCAVKRLKDSVRSNKYEVQKFQREAHLLRSLLHPGVLRVFGFCKLDFLLVTEVVTGGSLHEIIHVPGAPPGQPRPLLPQTLLEFAAMVADILRYLHLCSVVHRDIKPENLLVDSRGLVKLADFGLACEKKGTYIQTRSNLAGTPRYMAPESYRDEKCTEKIDIYSLSMLMWEMLTGVLPWDGSNFQDVRHAVATAGERPPIPAHTPQGIRELLQDCWHPQPEHRPAAADVLSRIAALGVRSKFLEMRERRHREEKERRAAQAEQKQMGLNRELSRELSRDFSRELPPEASPVAARKSEPSTPTATQTANC